MRFLFAFATSVFGSTSQSTFQDQTMMSATETLLVSAAPTRSGPACSQPCSTSPQVAFFGRALPCSCPHNQSGPLRSRAPPSAAKSSMARMAALHSLDFLVGRASRACGRPTASQREVVRSCRAITSLCSSQLLSYLHRAGSSPVPRQRPCAPYRG